MADRYCSNCRAELPEKVDACPECGVYAGDVFDERSLRPRTRRSFFVALIVAIAGVAALSAWLSMREHQSPPSTPKPEPPRTRVVGDRPGGARRATGAKVTEAEAIRLLRSHLASTKSIANACLVVMSHGANQGAYLLTAYNRCDNVRLGRWRVDGKTGDVAPAKSSG